MKTLSTLVVVLGLACGVAACAPKPTEEQCKQAVDNIRALTGQSKAEGGTDPKLAIRSCRAHSRRETVDCQIKAKSLDDLAACEGEEGKRFMEEQKKREAAETPAAAAPAPADPATPPAAQGEPAPAK